MSHTIDAFCSHETLCVRRDRYKEKADRHWFVLQNLYRKTDSLVRKLSLRDRLVTLLRTKDVPKLRLVLDVALRNGASVSRVIERVLEACGNEYRPQGNSEEDYKLTTLILRIGGSKLLFACSRAMGLPSRSDWYRKHFHRIVRIVPAPNLNYLELSVRRNLRAIFPEEKAYRRLKPCALMVDEIAINANVVYEKTFDVACGVCYKHSNKFKITASSLESLRLLQCRMQNGDEHATTGDRQTKEALVVSIAPFSNEGYTAKPVAILPTCKSGTREMQKEILDMIKLVYKSLKLDKIVGPIVSVYSDGDATRRQTWADSENKKIETDSELGKLLAGMPLIDDAVGPDDETHAMDAKHVLKRVRGLLKSKRGFVIGEAGGYFHAKPMVKRVLLATGTTEKDVKRMLTPSDDQNVPEAVQLLRAILDIRSFPPTNCGDQAARAALPDFVLLGHVIEGMLLLPLDLDHNLDVITRSVLKSGFVLFHLYRRHRIRLMPAQLYHDWQRIVKELVILIAKMQVAARNDGVFDNENVNCDFHPFQIGTDRQENQFRLVRTLTHNRNVDAATLPDRLSAVMQISDALEAHPEWDRGSRRLATETDDKINVKSIKGDRDVRCVNLDHCYDGAMRDALSALNAHPHYRHLSLEDFGFDDTIGINLLKPHGNHVGVSTANANTGTGGGECNNKGEDAAGRGGDPAPAAAIADTDDLDDSGNGEGAAGDGDASEIGTGDDSASEVGTGDESASDVGTGDDNATDIGGSSLLENLLALQGDDTGNFGAADDNSNVLIVDGHAVNKASVIKMIFGNGTSSSNDRLRRVRGMGCCVRKDAGGLGSDANEEGDMASVVMPGDVGTITAECEGRVIALCLVIVQRLDYGETTDLDHIECAKLMETPTWVHVRLAKLAECEEALVLSSNDVEPGSLKVKGKDFTPLHHSKVDEEGRQHFSLELLVDFKATSEPNSEGYKFDRRLQHAKLVFENSAPSPPQVALSCGICGVSLNFRDQFRWHVAGHFYKDDFCGIDNPFCGFCGATIQGDACYTTVSNIRGEKATPKVCSNCPYFPGDKMRYNSAIKPSVRSPCSNMPILCNEDECRRSKKAFWMLNVASHYTTAHSDLPVTAVIRGVVERVLQASTS